MPPLPPSRNKALDSKVTFPGQRRRVSGGLAASSSKVPNANATSASFRRKRTNFWNQQPPFEPERITQNLLQRAHFFHFELRRRTSKPIFCGKIYLASFSLFLSRQLIPNCVYYLSQRCNFQKDPLGSWYQLLHLFAASSAAGSLLPTMRTGDTALKFPKQPVSPNI